jgi:hypothetical protein
MSITWTFSGSGWADRVVADGRTQAKIVGILQAA